MFGAPDLPWLYAIALGLAVAATLGAVLIRGSRLGRGLLALRENEEAAETVGVPTTRLKLIAFVLSLDHSRHRRRAGRVAHRLFRADAGLRPDDLLHHRHHGGGRRHGRRARPAAGRGLLDPAVGAALGAAPQFYMVVLGLLLIFFVLFIPEGDRRHRAAPAAAEPHMTGLAVEQVSKSFGGLRALSDISFTVAAGETVGIMGANGAGKTTLFSLIAGHGRPDGGDIRLGSRSLLGLSPDRDLPLGIARTFQIVKPFGGLSVLDNVVAAALYRQSASARASAMPRPRPRASLAAVGLADRAGDLARDPDPLGAEAPRGRACARHRRPLPAARRGHGRPHADRGGRDAGADRRHKAAPSPDPAHHRACHAGA